MSSALFPDLEAKIYWSFAAVSPVCAPVRAAIDGWHQALATQGIAAVGRMIEAKEQLRGALAGLLGGSAERYALTQGTTASILAVARSLRWRRGAVVVFEGEFPTNVIPWVQAAREQGLEVLSLDSGLFADPAVGLARFEALVKGRELSLVAVSAVEFQSGLAMPVAELTRIAHAHGALVAVDAIQKAGVMPMDLPGEDVDFAYGGGHKWLLGVDGAGWLYVSEQAQGELGEAMQGWLSVEDATDFLVEPGRLGRERRALPMPRALEAGSASSAALFALLEGVRLCTSADPRKTLAWVQDLHDLVEAPMVELGFRSERAFARGARSGTLSLLPPADVSPRALQSALARRGVVLTTPDGRLRLAPHFFSTEAEAQTLVALMPEALAEVRATQG